MSDGCLREFVLRTTVILTPGVDGRCRAAVRGQDPLDPLDPGESAGIRGWVHFLRFRHKNNENENRKLKKSILPCFLVVFVADFSFSQCFTIETASFLTP